MVRELRVGRDKGLGSWPRSVGWDDGPNFRQSTTVVVLDTKILPRHVVAEKIAPSARDLG